MEHTNHLGILYKGDRIELRGASEDLWKPGDDDAKKSTDASLIIILVYKYFASEQFKRSIKESEKKTSVT